MKITWIIIITILIFLICFTLTNLLVGAYNLGKWSCTFDDKSGYGLKEEDKGWLDKTCQMCVLDAGSVGEFPLSPLEESKDGGEDNTPEKGDLGTGLPLASNLESQVQYWGEYYEIDQETIDHVIRTIECESNFRHLDDKGNLLMGQAGEIGLAQFKPATFEYGAKLYGMKYAQIDQPIDQIKLILVMIADGRGNYWTCFSKTR